MSIHLLSSIINDMENDLMKFSKRDGVNPGVVKQKEALIHKLVQVYEGYKHLTMWDVFNRIQTDVDGMLAKDPDLKGVNIILPLRPNQTDRGMFGVIDYSDKPKERVIEPESYLDKDYYLVK